MSASSFKHTTPQIVVFFAILVGVSALMHFLVTPLAIRSYAISFFGPPESKGHLEEFQGRYVVLQKDKPTADIPDKEKYGKEFIIDFSSQVRTEDKDGYHKKSSEWIIKSPKLGEEPIILLPLGFIILSLDIGFTVAIFLTMMMPSSVGFIALKIDRVIAHTKIKIRLNTGFNSEIVDVLTMPDDVLDRTANDNAHHVRTLFRKVWNETKSDHEVNGQDKFDEVYSANESASSFREAVLYARIAEKFSESILTEIENTSDAHDWQRNHTKITPALRLYMAHHFTEKYANNVTGFAYIGAAILIIIIGIRGLKFIPPTEPSLILFAILLEFSLLALLGVSLFYTEEEERMDKALEKLKGQNEIQNKGILRVAHNTQGLSEFKLSEDEAARALSKALATYQIPPEAIDKAVNAAAKELVVKALLDASARQQNLPSLSKGE